jgi:hypothetical protein
MDCASSSGMTRADLTLWRLAPLTVQRRDSARDIDVNLGLFSYADAVLTDPSGSGLPVVPGRPGPTVPL